MLRRPFFILFNLFIIIALSGCCPSSASHEDKEAIVSVNNYCITRSEFESEFKTSPYWKTDTPESRQEFLNTLIDRKLILQYAQKEGLDREVNFLKSIEKFWEQSLLKIALDKKTKDIEAKLSTSGWEAKRNEETKMLNDWMSELHKQAHITIKDGTLRNAADKNGGR